MKAKKIIGLSFCFLTGGAAIAQTHPDNTVNDSTAQTFFVDSAFVYAALEEVTVNAERPIVKVKDGKLTYDIRRLTEGKMVNNAYESLLQLPGVTENNGDLNLAGAHGLTVIINGRPTTMTTGQLKALLKSMPVSRIEKAEVMYAAPPRLHVRGGAINLVLKGYREGEGGLQGEITGTFAQQFYANGNGGVNLLYTSPRWSMDFLYNAAYSKERSDIGINSLHSLNGTIHDIRQQNRGASDDTEHSLRLGIDYMLKENSRLSFAYTGAFTPNSEQTETATGNFSNSVNNVDEKSDMHNAALDYTSAFGLNAGINYTFFRNRQQQHFTDGYETEENSFLTHERQQISRWKIYADQSHELSDGWTLNYGSMFTYAGNKNMQHYDMEKTGSNGMEVNNSYSNNREYTFNLYGGFSKSFSESLSLTASVTAEYYKLENYKKWALYPAAELSWNAAPGHMLQLSFSTDKSYPDYWTLQESIGYMNKYMEVHGNPYLRPSTDYCTTLNYILKSKYIASLSYDHNANYFQQLAYQSSERLALIYKTLNWDYVDKLSLTFVAPFEPAKWWRSKVTGSASYNRARCDVFFDTSFDHKRWILQGQLENHFTLSQKPAITMEVSGGISTPQLQGSYRIASVWMVNAGVKWTSSNQKAEVRLKGSNLFDTIQPDIRIRNGAQHLDMDIFMDTRMVSLSFSYKFGGYKEKRRKGVDTSRFKL